MQTTHWPNNNSCKWQIIPTERGWWIWVQNKQSNQVLLSVLLAGSRLRNVTAPPKAVCWPSSLENLSWTMWVLSLGFTQAHNRLFVCILAARWDALYTMPTYWGLREHPVLSARTTAKPAFPTWSKAVGWDACVPPLFVIHGDASMYVAVHKLLLCVL